MGLERRGDMVITRKTTRRGIPILINLPSSDLQKMLSALVVECNKSSYNGATGAAVSFVVEKRCPLYLCIL
jgi:hypothetical protein